MRVKFRDLVKDGPKALLYGGTVGFVKLELQLGSYLFLRITLKKAPENSGAFFMLQT